MFTTNEFNNKLWLKSTTLNDTFTKLKKLQTEWKFQKLFIKHQKEVNGNNATESFKTKVNKLSY